MACDVVEVRADSNLSIAHSKSRVSAQARDKYFQSFITTKEGYTVLYIRRGRDYKLLGINDRAELASSYTTLIKGTKRVIILYNAEFDLVNKHG